MKLCYDKLWQLMKDHNMDKNDLARSAKISSYAMERLNTDAPVSTDVMITLCQFFHCDIGDIMEVIEED